VVTPRIRRVLETALECGDLPRTAAFYRGLFPGPPMLDTERLVALDAGEGTVLLLFQQGASAEGVMLPGGFVPGHQGSGPAHLAFAVDAPDLAWWDAQLGALGIAIESRVTWERGGRSVYFRDPDGRSVELATPGVWPAY
jgi:catechol 2,3-dioxygenase-like lactoylglutathione lyase family enzyme